MLLCLYYSNANSQTYLETFGQNRIQYRSFNWKVFETEHFRIYHYDRSGKDLARYVAEQAESDVAQIEQQTKFKIKEIFHIILYNTYDEYRQTNVGRKNDMNQIRSSETGSFDAPDDRIVVYFNGIHTDLREQIREGLSRALLSKKIKGGSLGKMAVNSAKVDLPAWLEAGYIDYTSQGWTETTDKAWKGWMETNPRSSLHQLSESVHGTLAGQAFWKYIAERYGKEEVPYFMSYIKNKGNLNKAIKGKYQMNVVRFFDSCLTYYKEKYEADASDKTTPDPGTALVKIPVPKDNTLIRNIRVSPRGADVVYVKWKDGEFKVCLKHTSGDQNESVILEGGEKNYNEDPDPNYPLMTWSNTGYKLAILYKKGPQLRLRIYDATKGKLSTSVIPANRFDRALGMAIDEDNDAIILSAIRKSQTDLYHFTIKGSKMRNITNDLWDDVEPAFVTGGQKRGIIFLSNRPKPNLSVPIGVNEMPTGPMNVFFYNTTTKSPELFQCSNSDGNTSISQPIQYGPDNFAYISDANGTKNKYVVVYGRDKNNQDSAYWTAATNLSYSLNSHQYNPAGDLVANVIQQNGNYCVYIEDLKIPNLNFPSPKVKQAILVEDDVEKVGIDNNAIQIRKKSKKERLQQSQRGTQNASSVNLPDGNTFQTEFSPKNQGNSDSENKNIAENEEDLIEEDNERVTDSSFIKMRARPYKLGFRANEISMSLDNNVLFNRYQPASQNGNQFANPSLAGLILVSVDDVLEDYRFTGGFRYSFQNPGSTYFAQFENVKRRVDWNVAFMRNTQSQVYTLTFTDTFGNPLFNTLGVGKTTTSLLQGTASYPIDKMRSVRLQLGVRQDVLHFKSIDTFTHIVPPDKKYWTMSRLEYVFDNSKIITTNIRNGTRYKAFAEYMHQMNDNGGGVYNFGFDFRTYQPLYKNVIWALKVTGAHSGGRQKILYFMGGVDNWINYSQANAPVNQESYGFQTISNNLRGYRQNARNGNSFALANTEIRVPIVNTFINRPVASSILRSLQFVTFADFGVAWNGLFPNDQTMQKNRIIGQRPVLVSVNVPGAEGTALGYGVGARVAVSSYQFRLDAAWNKGGSPTPLLYFSLGTDF